MSNNYASGMSSAPSWMGSVGFSNPQMPQPQQMGALGSAMAPQSPGGMGGAGGGGLNPQMMQQMLAQILRQRSGGGAPMAPGQAGGGLAV